MKKIISVFMCLFLLAILVPYSKKTLAVATKPENYSLQIKYVNEEKIKIWDGMFSFGKFTLQNATKKDIAFYVDASTSNVILDSRIADVENQKNGSWHYDITVLEELEPSTQMLTLKPGAKLMFYVEMHSFFQHKESNVIYRLTIRDTGGKAYTSELFQIK